MSNDERYVLASCPRDGAMWLEAASYTPATRWEPDDYEVAMVPCPKCGNEEDILYAETTPFGPITAAALECAYSIANTVEWWGLPNCTRCGQKAWEGGSMCPICVEKAAREYYEEQAK